MLTFEEIKEIVDNCTFEDWQILVRLDGKRPYIQVYVPNGKDAVTGEPLAWTGRKWMLSYHMVKNEIVRSVFKAVTSAMQHEVEEAFKYKGVSIYNPHIDPEALVKLVSDSSNIDERPNNAFAA